MTNKEFEMELARRLSKKYRGASKKTRSKILDKYCEAVPGIKRDTACKRLQKYAKKSFKPRVLKSKNQSKKRGPKPKYGPPCKKIIKKAWELGGRICAERLLPILGEYLNQLKTAGALKNFKDSDITSVSKISEKTLKRIIAEFPNPRSRKHKGQANIYKKVPIEANFGKYAKKVGYFEIDYVESNGGLSSGIFVNSGCYVDVGNQWVARAAGLGKNLSSIASIHKKVSSKIYHQVKKYHPDNCQPILKELFEKYQGKKVSIKIALSRSRPYKKNDNAHVEQKNDDKIRKIIGYFRYDTQKAVEVLNEFYDVEDLITNFFVPSQKLVERIYDDQHRVIKRIHDKAQTPYQRLMTDDRVDKKVKFKLTVIYKSLDLVKLRKRSDKLKARLSKLRSKLT